MKPPTTIPLLSRSQEATSVFGGRLMMIQMPTNGETPKKGPHHHSIRYFEPLLEYVQPVFTQQLSANLRLGESLVR